jgi:hypothetical protein
MARAWCARPWPRLPGSYHARLHRRRARRARRLGDAVPQVSRAQEFSWRALERGFKPAAGGPPWR